MWLSGSVRIRVSTGLRYVKPENVVSLKLALYAPRITAAKRISWEVVGGGGAQSVIFVAGWWMLVVFKHGSYFP
jgi:hypothetical protein